MPICSDPALTYLTGYGYNVVRLPSTKIQPLDAMGNEGGQTEWLGSMTQLCESRKPPPEVTRHTATAINATSSSALRLGVGIRILRGILSSFNIDGPALGAAYSGAKYLRIAIDSPVVRTSNIAEVGEWLLTAKPRKGNPVVKHYFGNPNCKAYVVTETLTSDSFTVAALDKEHRSVNLSLPGIHQALGGDLDAISASGNTGELRCVGKEFLTFGFKAYSIVHSFGIWVISGIRPGEAVCGTSDNSAKPHIIDDGWLKVRIARKTKRFR